MRRRQILLSITICFLTVRFSPVGDVKAENLALAEKQATASRQAMIARENADRAALTNLIAGKQAVWADQKSTAARNAEIKCELAGFKLRKTAHGSVLTLGDVLFAPDESELTATTMHKLSPLVTLLRDQPQRTIHIEGYADSSGPETYNLTLSQRRADAVQEFLVARGISPRRITARGYGEAISVASNTNLARRQENRRAEVVVLR